MWTRAAGFGRRKTGRRLPRPTPRCSRCSDRSQSPGTQSPPLQDTVSFHTVSEGFWLPSPSVLRNSHSSSGSQPPTLRYTYMYSLYSYCSFTSEAFDMNNQPPELATINTMFPSTNCNVFHVLLSEQRCLFEIKTMGKTSLTLNAQGSYC